MTERIQRRKWIKLFCSDWLHGSIRDEDPMTRAIFVDLLTLAGDSGYDGTIKFNKRVGYNDEQLAEMLSVNVDDWLVAKKQLAEHKDPKENRIVVLDGNIIKILKWSKYQSEYARQKPYRSKGEGEKPEDLLILWNRVCVPTLPRVLKPTKTRVRKASARLEERTLVEWEQIFLRMLDSEFLTGQNQTGWKASFDWVVRNEDNAIKILEGKYDRRNGTVDPLDVM